MGRGSPVTVCGGAIPEEYWVGSGWEGVYRDNSGVACAHRGPLVVGSVWKKLSVRLEVRDTAVVGAVVKSRIVVGAKRFGVSLAIAACSRGVRRAPAPAKADAPMRKPLAGGILCFSCVKAGHLLRDYRSGVGLGPSGCPPFRCWGCGMVGHWITFCPERSLPMMSATGVPVSVAGAGTVSGGVKRGGSHLAESGLCGKPYMRGSVLVYLGGGLGRLAAAPQGARA